MLYSLQLGEGSANPAPETELTLPFAEILDEEEEEDVISLPVMAAMEPTATKVPAVINL